MIREMAGTKSEMKKRMGWILGALVLAIGLWFWFSDSKEIPSESSHVVEITSISKDTVPVSKPDGVMKKGSQVKALSPTAPSNAFDTAHGLGSIKGDVLDQSDRPLEGVKVTVRAPGDDVPFLDPVFTSTEGTFRFEDLPAGEFRLVGEHPSYAQSETYVFVIPETEAEALLRLSNAGRLVVYALEAETRIPLVGKPIGLHPADLENAPTQEEVVHDHTMTPWATQETDASGRAVFEDLPGGSYMIIARIPGYRVLVDFHNLPNGQQAEHTVSMVKTGFTHGRVVDTSGKPQPNVEVFCEYYTGWNRYRTVTDENGAFQFYAADARMVLYARDGSRVSKRVKVDCQSDTCWKELVLGGETRIAVTVIDNESGKAFSGAQVCLISEENQYSPCSYTLPPAGEAFFEGVLPGRYRVAASAPGYLQNVSGSFKVEVGEAMQRQSMNMDPGRCIEGRVEDSEGEPVAGVRIKLDFKQGDMGMRLVSKNASGGIHPYHGNQIRSDGRNLYVPPGLSTLAPSDHKGHFRFCGLPEGQVTVGGEHSVAPRYFSPVEVDITTGDVTGIVLKAAGEVAVHGRFVNAQGEPCASGAVWLSGMPPGVPGGGTHVGPNGSFTLNAAVVESEWTSGTPTRSLNGSCFGIGRGMVEFSLPEPPAEVEVELSIE